MRTELTAAKEKLLKTELHLKEEQIALRCMEESALEAHKSLDSTQGELNKVSDDIAGIYYTICGALGEVAQRVLLNQMGKIF